MKTRPYAASIAFVISIICFSSFESSAQIAVQLGTGEAVTGSTSASPVNVWFRSIRCQMVYTAEELRDQGAKPGTIQKLGFYIESSPVHTLPNYSIKMKHTSAVNVQLHDGEVLTEVYHNSNYAPSAGGFDTLSLDVPFFWNGIDNILVDVCFDRVPNFNSSGTVRYYNAPLGFRYVHSDSDDNCPNETSIINSQKPQIVFEFSDFPNNDAGILSIDEPVIFCEGLQEISVTLANFGTEPLNTVQIMWEFDGVTQSPVNYNTTILPFDEGHTASVSLGSKQFTSGVEHEILTWTANPNGAGDEFPENDSMQVSKLAGLQGQYTLGGVNPDFESFTELANIVNQFGICANTTINVRNGSYNEQVQFGEISGADSLTTLTIQSETGDSSLVALTWSADFEANYTLHLNGTNWLTISNISIESTNNSYARAILLSNGAGNNKFSGNYLSSINTSFGGTNMAIVQISSDANSHSNQFSGNYFNRGHSGIYFDGTFSLRTSRLKIDNNQFFGQSTYGIFLEYADSVEVSGNSYRMAATNAFYTGIYLSSIQAGVEIYGNEVYNVFNGQGIAMFNVNGSENNYVGLYNNFIHIAGDQQSYGIYTSGGSYQRIAHNSVNLTNTHPESRALYSLFGSEKLLANNILANSGTGYSVYLSGTSSIASSDYNDLFTSGEYLGLYNSIEYSSLVDWQAMTLMDGNSISENPLFHADTSYQTAQIALDGAGTGIPEISFDIEGESRNAEMPDIGADEFIPEILDAGLAEIKTAEFPFSEGDQDVIATLKNFGSGSIESVTIHWQINGADQAPINWSGVLESKEIIDVELGNVNFVLGQPYSVKSWTTAPNGMQDPISVNDTLKIDDLYAGLNGIYTIGGNDPDFETINTAVNLLNKGGVAGEVNFSIRTGEYIEQVIISDFPGSDSLRQVVFSSETQVREDVIIRFNQSSSDNYIVLIEGANWLQFKDLSFESQNSFNSRNIHFTQNAGNITFENTVFESPSTTTTSSTAALVFSFDEGINHLEFLNCDFRKGAYGAYLAGTFSSTGSQIILDGNSFVDQYSRGVYLDYINSVSIRFNQIQSSINANFFRGIMINDNQAGLSIHSNQIYNLENGVGILLEDVLGNENAAALIYNNFIQISGTTTSHGIYSNFGGHQVFANNTVSISNESDDGSAMYVNFGNTKSLYNNILSNSGMGYALYLSSLDAVEDSDYNDLYSRGDRLTFAGSNVDNLQDWILSSDLDQNSISEDPLFVSDSSFQVTQIALNGAGLPLDFVLLDIEGDMRDSESPDIGADEYSPPPIDAGVSAVRTAAFPFPAGSQELFATVKNFGTEALGNLNIQWSVNDINQEMVDWSGSLFSNDTVQISIGSIDFEIGQPYKVKAWAENPNNLADQVAANDTAVIENLYAGLGGVYSLGGVDADFTDLTHAVTTLNHGGVVDETYIQIADGQYNEQLVIEDYPGADSSKIVTFQSISEDSTAVTILHAADFDNNYTILHDGSAFINWKQITIEGLGGFYSRAVVFEQGAHHINFFDNVLKGPSTTTTSNSSAVIFSNSDRSEYIIFEGNHVEGGSVGIYMNNGSLSNEYNKGLYLKANRFINQYWTSAYLRNQEFIHVSDNRIESNSTYFSYAGLYLVDCYEGGLITSNQITNIDRTYGILASSCFGNEQSSFIVANNFVHMSGEAGDDVFGIYTSFGNNQKFLFNSVHAEGTHEQSRVFYNNSGTNKTVLNNIFSNSGAGYAYYNLTAAAIIESDHNDLFTNGNNIGYLSGNIADLAGWQGASGMDVNSLSVDPNFVDASDLHTSSIQLDKAGKAVPEINTDIDGEIRDPVRPDIGADEFTTSENDAGIASIDSPTIPFAANLQEIYVTLFNNGILKLESVILNWEVNGVIQTPAEFIGNLESGMSMDSILIGSYTFEVDSIYSIVAWTSNPNGVPDMDNFNDTARVDSLYAGLEGVYAIGGEGADFDSFSSAVRAMHNGGVVGEVIFNVRSGSYDEQICIREVLGASEENTVTFQSELLDSSAVQLRAEGNLDSNYVVKLEGADWIRFQYLSFVPLDQNYARIIDFSNGASYNVFSNNIFEGLQVITTDARFALVFSSTGTDSQNEFSNNRFLNGSYGLYWYGTDNFEHESGTIILNNQFENQYYRGILFVYQDSPSIAGNQITSETGLAGFIGILGSFSSAHLRLLSNYIYGIEGGEGIRLESCNGEVSNSILIANQFIQAGSEQNLCNGIVLRSCNNVKAYFNSINITSENQGSSAFRAETSGGNVRVLNNNLVNSGGGYSYYNNNVGIPISNFNNLYSNGELLGFWNDVNAPLLSDWQETSGLDASSISRDPTFISPTDLHVEEIDLNGHAIAVPEVTEDFDGESRHPQNPDIGADEFSPVIENDAGIAEFIQPSNETPFPGGNQQILATVINHGSNDLLSATVHWKINNIEQQEVEWTGNLSPGERDTVTLGDFNFVIGVGHDILAFTQGPNGQPDLQPSNDTLSLTGLFPGLEGEYTIGGQFPDFNTLGEAVFALNKGGVLGPVTFNMRNGVYPEQIQIIKAKGVNQNNQVIFQSESGANTDVTIEFGKSTSIDNYVVLLDGAQYIHFQNLSIHSSHPDYGTVIELRNGASNNQINGNAIQAASGNYSALIHSEISSTNSNNVISDNLIENGGYGISLNGRGPSVLEPGNSIIGNQFVDQRFAAIYMLYQTDFQCDSNEVSSSQEASNFYGIYLRECDGGFEVEKNYVHDIQGHGIWIDRCDGLQDSEGYVFNNFIHVEGGAVANGIYIYSGRNLNIYSNNVHVTSSHAASSAMRNWGGDNKDVLNNNFINSGGGYAYYNEFNSGIASSNFNNLFASGPYTGFWSGSQAIDISDWQNLSGRDNTSLSVDPLFTSDTDLHVFQSQLDSMAIPLVDVTDDFDGDARDPSFPDIGADEFSYILDDVGIVGIINPASGCELGSGELITLEIQNFSGLTLSGFDVAIKLGEQTPVIENIGELTIAPGLSQEYTFSETFDLSELGTYEVSAYTLLPDDTNLSNDTIELIIENLAVPESPGNLIPADGIAGLSNNIAFSWSPSGGATNYDLFVWPANESRPEIPIAEGLEDINYLYSNAGLSPGEMYLWQVIAKNDYCSGESPVQSFSLFDLPDLVVSDVQIPDDAFSGREIEVRWDVNNMGEGHTGMTQWIDAVYLSDDAILDFRFDTYLGGFSNASALNPMESYSNMVMVNLPEGLSGTYYLFIWTDRYNRLREEDEENNTGRSFGEVTITLTPPPDLQVTSIVTSNNAFSGSDFDITWTVTNTGAGNTLSGGWTDYAYLHDSDTLDMSKATFFGQLQYNDMLKIDSSYTQMITGKIPNGISGDHYIHVVTDVFAQEFEFASEGNNTSVSTPINIILTPPPDLIVSDIVIPPEANNLETIPIGWTVVNQGGSETSGNWKDKVYLSDMGTSPDLEEAILLGEMNRVENLNLGESYTIFIDAVIPDGLSGTYFIYVVTDSENELFEFNNEDNNTGRSALGFSVNHADLAVENVELEVSEAESGDSIMISWEIANKGPGDLAGRDIGYQIYFSDNPSFGAGTLSLEFSAEANSDLMSGQSISFNQRVMLPNGISGDYYVFVFVDPDNLIFEGGQENNNVNDPGREINIELAPWVDLLPMSLTIADSVSAGANVPFSYVLQNNGTKAAQDISWSDQIYISSSSIWNPNNVQLLRVLANDLDISIGSEMTIETNLNIPLSLLTGNFYIHVSVDTEDEIYEYTGETNNRISTSAILITGYPAIDLTVSEIMHSNSVNTGQEIDIQWTVSNLSESPTIAPGWIDAIYLSSDTQLQRNSDILLEEIEQTGLIEAGSSYTDQITVRIPDGLNGAYFILVYTDNGFAHNDFDQSNNLGILKDGQENIVATTVELTPPPDLVISSFESSAQATAGQPIEVRWTVTNSGQGPTRAIAWTDRIYLSNDFTLDGSDKILGSFAHTGSLTVGETYSDTASVNIPINVSGNRILIIKTDVNNKVFEFQAENNNAASLSIDVFEAPPSDLRIVNIVVPPSAKAGEDINIQWILRNEGENPASGYMQEAVYLSTDTIWDIQDPLIAKEALNINLAPQVSLNRSVQATLTGVSVGNFYAIVRTDILNNIAESDESNNQKVSDSTVEVDVQEIFLGISKLDTLENDQAKFYRIEITSDLIGESMLTFLAGDSLTGNNELYLRYGDIPSRVDFDFSFGESFAGVQEVIVPELNAGTYYILVYGNSFANLNQEFEITASILNFEIRRIDDNKGGNSGNVTVRVDGSKFEEGMEVSLTGNGTEIHASKVLYQSPTRVYARFDLTDQPLGMYDINGKKGNGESTTLPNSFEIVFGEAPSIATNISHPGSTRLNRIVTMRVDYTNDGNVDIISPAVILESLGGAPFALTLENLDLNITELELNLIELNGPPGVLRPGASGSITVYIKAIAPIAYVLVLPEFF